MNETLELTAERQGERTLLRSPGVGLFTCAVPAGRSLVTGQTAGVLRTLGVSRPLVVPAGARGRIVSARPERVHEPVEYDQVLYELELVRAGEVEDEAETASAGETTTEGLVVTSSQTGRFWRRPGPGEPSFAEVGDELEAGSPLGLVEVMKTFTHVTYQPTADLPARARIVEFLADDGAEVNPGTPLVRVESA